MSRNVTNADKAIELLHEAIRLLSMGSGNKLRNVGEISKQINADTWETPNLEEVYQAMESYAARVGKDSDAWQWFLQRHNYYLEEGYPPPPGYSRMWIEVAEGRSNIYEASTGKKVRDPWSPTRSPAGTPRR